MADQTSRLNLPWLMPAQAQKHVTVNEAFRRLDAVVHPSATSRKTLNQPGSPEEGEGFILPVDALGASWSAMSAGSLAVFQDGYWTEIHPFAGLQVYVRDEDTSLIHDGTQWRALAPEPVRFDGLEALGVEASPDAFNRLAVRTNGAYFTALESATGGSGDLRLTLNKEASDDVVSLMFQSAWSGRIELGLAGDDDLTLKTSTDGQTWQEAFKLDHQTGRTHLAGLTVLDDHLRLTTAATPASASADGVKGSICWDSAHLYVCVADNQWKRVALSDW